MPRSLNCPKCSKPITIPDGYTKTGIMCPACRAAVDVRTGAVYQKPATGQAAQPATEKAQENTPPALEIVEEPQAGGGVAPPSMYEMPPMPPEKPDRAWIKTAVGGAAIVLAAVIGITAWMMHSKAKEVEMLPVNANWETLSLPEAWFSVDLPGRPEGGGGPNHSHKLTLGNTTWTVEWHDLGVGAIDTIPFDFNVAVNQFAGAAQYKVDKIPRVDLMGFPGRKGVLTGPDDAQGSVRLLRRGNRVYLLGVTGLTEGNAEAGEKFLNSIKLLPVVYTAGASGGAAPLALAYKDGTAMSFFEDNEASRAAGITGGTPPYTLTLGTRNLPTGLKAITDGGSMVVSGGTQKPGDYTVNFSVIDAAGAQFSGTLAVHVEANPFTIKVEPAIDEKGNVVVDDSGGVKIRLLVDGPAKELIGTPEWYASIVPTGLKAEPELDGMLVSGPAGTGEGQKVTIDWTGKGKEGRLFKRRVSFTIEFKVPKPKDGG